MISPQFNYKEDPRFKRHESLIYRFLNHTSQYGYYALHSMIIPEIFIPEQQIKKTFLNRNLTYSESLSYAQKEDIHPKGYSRRFEAKSQSGDVLTSQVTTCYTDGYLVTDGYIDIFCQNDDGFNPNWFIYKIQRHLQLTKEVFENYADNVICVIHFDHLEAFKWEIYFGGHIRNKMPYSGYHEDIIFTVALSQVNGRDKWNLKMQMAEDAMLKIARIFGLDGLPQPYWHKDGVLDYPTGFPSR